MTVSTHDLHTAAQAWLRQDGEADQVYEGRMSAGVTAAALDLLCVSKALGWGSGEPVMDAEIAVVQVATEHAAFFRYKQPRPGPRVVRKQLGAGVMRAVWDRDGWECQECGDHRDLTVDHIIPVALGGSNDTDNLQTLCKSCNSRKGARV